MGFTLSRSFVREVHRLSPLKPITIESTWWDDNEGMIAQLRIRHKLKDRNLVYLTSIKKGMSNKQVLRNISRGLLHWNKYRRVRS